MSTLFRNLFSNLSTSYVPSPTAGRDSHPTSFPVSHSASFNSGLNRSTSQRGPPKLTHILRQLRVNITQPFALAHHQNDLPPMNSVTTDTTTSDGSAVTRSNTGTLLQEKLNSNSTGHLQVDDTGAPIPHHLRDPRDSSKQTFFSRAFRSDDPHEIGGKEYLGLPFRLTVYTAQEHVSRNVPYLRHSWNRIDFIAILSFWITFALAQSGVERSFSEHIAVFRALSVLRTSRLLAVTNGTTVSTMLMDANSLLNVL